MGSDHHYPEERPTRMVEVEPFLIDVFPVTNRAFMGFVAETGYVTVAEKPPDPTRYPLAQLRDLVPGSLVFSMTERPVPLTDFCAWWKWTPGACWRQPQGPGSDLEGLEEHPVVHVAYQDALEYARWAGKALPSEEQWEYAARGGREGKVFEWGNQDYQESAPRANTWQGRFPYENTRLDGWVLTSPVGWYPPNGFGLHDLTGNVWEWTSTPFDRPGSSIPPGCGPTGPSDPDQGTEPIPYLTIKGGSHLCSIRYCFRYRPAARQPQTPDTSTGHIGFRCISEPS